VISLLIAAAVSLAFAMAWTPAAIRTFRSHDIGQFIQAEVRGHMHKRGTPTMGGIVMIFGTVLGYVVAHFRILLDAEGVRLAVRPFAQQGFLALFAFLGMGLIGFLDDYVKYARKRNQGLSKRWKFLGQMIVAVVFAWAAVASGASTELSFTRPLGVDLGPVVYVGLVLFMLTATANAVNLTDGLDGLVAGSGALVFGAYVLIAFWEFRNLDVYGVAGALDIATLGAALMGATLGFLWWNAPPARIFMGDTGSQALGGALAALALLTNTQLLLVLLGGLYVVETLSVIGQVVAFRGFHRRIFRMAPIHHHFELRGWPETTVIIRFWILAGILVAVGVGVFYADFLQLTGGGLSP